MCEVWWDPETANGTFGGSALVRQCETVTGGTGSSRLRHVFTCECKKLHAHTVSFSLTILG